jgi:protein-ribulosamine 3-kinase
MTPWTEVAAQISSSEGIPFIVEKVASIGGGCINRTYRVEGSGRQFFVKLNNADALAMFEAEAAGLKEIRGSQSLRAPAPLCWGTNSMEAWLVLEYLEMKDAGRSGASAFGQKLAAMHRFSSQKFGWVRDNTIGSTTQMNKFSTGWTEFWRERRLGYQLQLARANGYTGGLQKQGEQLMERLVYFFPGPQPSPSLLHGDLWAGNYSFDDSGQPVVYDPAVYYGDRETDIAMTELFGGFANSFYAAYREAYPLEPEYETRKTLYNLYHILNHLNLFGRSYLRQAEQMLGRLLAEVN